MTSRTTNPRPERALAESARSLLRADAVRKSAQRMLMLALEGRLEDWTVDLDRLAATADFVAGVVRERYPRLDVPVHSRWRHFVFGGRDLWNEIVLQAKWESTEAAARSAFDLVITSVLVDAGAGGGWRYHDRATGLVAARSEGLALASLRWFESGGLANNPTDLFRVDAAALRRVDGQAIQNAFQAHEANPLLGLEGRAALLNRLGAVMESRPDLFAVSDSPRPGGLFDALRARAANGRLPAATILETLLEALGPIWQGRPSLGGVPLGDCWPHPALVGQSPEDGYAPLHKLSQWLTYSLLEPLENAGISVSNVQELTGLAEYRNGGLFVDMGVLNPRERAALSTTYAVKDPFVVGWRALTVALLDRLAPLVGTRLGLTPELFPLPCVLEGGTWAAGRLIAHKTRADGGPPFHVLSDGTVF
ncbi:MAG TPA: DUF1688 family protein [Steroidobacteraceae bacterium]|nr:DUF1688 family protein [Steroidobacteraceae bacterium]